MQVKKINIFLIIEKNKYFYSKLVINTKIMHYESDN